MHGIRLVRREARLAVEGEGLSSIFEDLNEALDAFGEVTKKILSSDEKAHFTIRHTVENEEAIVKAVLLFKPKGVENVVLVSSTPISVG